MNLKSYNSYYLLEIGNIIFLSYVILIFLCPIFEKSFCLSIFDQINVFNKITQHTEKRHSLNIVQCTQIKLFMTQPDCSFAVVKILAVNKFALLWGEAQKKMANSYLKVT